MWDKGGILMINTNVFDYVNVLNKAADAAWTRNDVLANNIANMDTPLTSLTQLLRLYVN